MLKNLTVFGIIACLFALFAFKLAEPPARGKSKRSVKTQLPYYSPDNKIAKNQKFVPIKLSAMTTFSPGSTPALVEFDFETSTNTITGSRIYYTSGQFKCLEYCVVGSITGGSINFAGGAWRAVGSITSSCDWGSATISGGTVFSTFNLVCDTLEID